MADLQFFESIQNSLETETNLRENIRNAVRGLERLCRAVAATLNQVHSATTETVISTKLEAAASRFSEIRLAIKKVAELVPPGQYYRYNNIWNFPLQQAVFLSAYTKYLHSEQLISIPEAEEMLGTEVNLRGDSQAFHIGIEDYLHGLVNMTSELSRLAVNCVTAGDFERPLRISRFVGELYSGFQLLNLKNDALRKRFDGIKYDIKKIEEVVYDISVRGLTVKTDAPASNV
ncbi:translin-like protein [Powellomyces hirtus]|nr:translin-like protein [Powellomyces hirtus]